ncbi:MAG: type II secretion system GspH family protein [Candidatus Pacebacteria bacterium]|nr:type II secretion system GspH family protein [Candidatus Paceibacterota bacterium]MCF7862552.1 type II secretion system GspH family protein [Candidatus Paceibacterota bacterium]
MLFLFKKYIKKIFALKVFFEKRFSLVSFQAGMTYVELIVVMSIFATMSGVILFNYNEFQEKINIKVLGGEIAMKIVEAQKKAVGGERIGLTQSSWRPSYGVLFNDLGAQSRDVGESFIFWIDLDNDKFFNDVSCTPGVDECLDKVLIPKGIKISKLKFVEQEEGRESTVDEMSIVYTRPNASPTFADSEGLLPYMPIYAEIEIKSPNDITGSIRVYSSGRIEIK